VNDAVQLVDVLTTKLENQNADMDFAHVRAGSRDFRRAGAVRAMDVSGRHEMSDANHNRVRMRRKSQCCGNIPFSMCRNMLRSNCGAALDAKYVASMVTFAPRSFEGKKPIRDDRLR
jgi:hypothetical protein